MKIAIVGTSSELSENQERDIRQFVSILLKKYNPKNDIIISGGAKSIDSIAIEIAKNLGFRTIIHNPEKHIREFYLKRNRKIADECDMLYCFSIPVKTQKCYHHDTLMDHEKTAGCYTLKHASEQNKPCELYVLPR